MLAFGSDPFLSSVGLEPITWRITMFRECDSSLAHSLFGGGSNGNAHTVGVWKKYGARVVASAASYLRLIMAFLFRLAFLIFLTKIPV